LDGLHGAPEPNEVVASLVEFLKPFGKGLFVAHNAKFDYDFLSTLLERHGGGVTVGELVDHRILCTIQMAFQKFVLSEQRLTKLSLSQLSEYFKIPHNPHEAFSDVLVAAELLRICLRQPFWFRLARGIRLAFRERSTQQVTRSLRQVF
jgi:DNA polymerase-3 subunit epsilon